MKARFLVLAALLFLGGGARCAEPLQDGPYIMQAAGGGWLSRWVEGSDGSPRVREQPVAVGDAVKIAAVGTLPAFEVKLRSAEKIAPDEIKIRPRTPLFVMADTHGEFEIAVQLLQRQHVIDEQLHWSFGKGRLAILGDVFDRGRNQTELLWLFYKLEAEAARAGGGVHLAIGNHESMLLKGDERYLNPKYKQVATLLGSPHYSALWDEQTLLGRWLRTKAAVFRLGDYLCLHGGVSRELVDRGLTLSQVNATVRESLTARANEASASPNELSQLVMGRAGPLWYRGYFAEEAREGGFNIATSADVDLILEKFQVRRILVGHTTVPTVTSLYGGRVIAVQVYPHRDKETNAPVMEGLLIQGGKLFRAGIDGNVEPLLEAAAAPQKVNNAPR